MREVILVVDDEPTVLNIVSTILANAEFTVLRASDPAEALDTARRHDGPIRLLVSDVVMPGMSGPDLADALATEHPETECLFIAGLPDSPEICNRILSHGRPFLPKPFLARTLLDKVRQVLAVERRVAASSS